jgi:hypothetical protein
MDPLAYLTFDYCRELEQIYSAIHYYNIVTDEIPRGVRKRKVWESTVYFGPVPFYSDSRFRRAKKLTARSISAKQAEARAAGQAVAYLSSLGIQVDHDGPLSDDCKPDQESQYSKRPMG